MKIFGLVSSLLVFSAFTGLSFAEESDFMIEKFGRSKKVDAFRINFSEDLSKEVSNLPTAVSLSKLSDGIFECIDTDQDGDPIDPMCLVNVNSAGVIFLTLKEEQKNLNENIAGGALETILSTRKNRSRGFIFSGKPAEEFYKFLAVTPEAAADSSFSEKKGKDITCRKKLNKNYFWCDFDL